MSKNFQIMLASPFDHERLTAEIYVDEKLVAAVIQERAEGEFDLEFPGPNSNESCVLRVVDFETFFEAAKVARRALKGD